MRAHPMCARSCGVRNARPFGGMGGHQWMWPLALSAIARPRPSRGLVRGFLCYSVASLSGLPPFGSSPPGLWSPLLFCVVAVCPVSHVPLSAVVSLPPLVCAAPPVSCRVPAWDLMWPGIARRRVCVGKRTRRWLGSGGRVWATRWRGWGDRLSGGGRCAGRGSVAEQAAGEVRARLCGTSTCRPPSVCPSFLPLRPFFALPSCVRACVGALCGAASRSLSLRSFPDPPPSRSSLPSVYRVWWAGRPLWRSVS